MDGSKDFVAVKAREAFDFCTSMNCLESNGQKHTFLVAYREHPERLDVNACLSPSAAGTAVSALAPADSLSLSSLSNIATMKQELYHIGTLGYGLQIPCENIFYKDDVLFLLISVRNSSAVSYELATPRFAVESAKRAKRGLRMSWNSLSFYSREYTLRGFEIPLLAKAETLCASIHSLQRLKSRTLSSLRGENGSLSVL